MFNTFPKSISLKVNVIARLDFELAYWDLAFKHVNHDTTGDFSFIYLVDELNIPDTF